VHTMIARQTRLIMGVTVDNLPTGWHPPLPIQRRNMSSNYHEEISNNLDDIRKELRIANQLKLIELQHLSAEVFTPTALSELWTKLSAMLTVTPRSKERV
jgi:predicted mannosyl-3-phosphoglycerate phosphatase (HAD superfamily)